MHFNATIKNLRLIIMVVACITIPPAAADNTACAPETVSVHCGKTPSAVWFDDRLWVAFVQGEYVYVTHSQDKGQSYSAPFAVNSKPETIESNGENRPKIAATKQALLVSWTQKTAGRYTGDIRFSRSVNGGKSFTPPRTINDDGLLNSHRFDGLLATDDGTVYLAWLDKRDKQASLNAGRDYPGSALYYSVSQDHGEHFSANRKIADNSCECCRLAMALADGGAGAAIFWRHIFLDEAEQVRDHALALISADGELDYYQRATANDWQINACPHHGPDLAKGTEKGAYHLAWFSGGTEGAGVYYGLHSVDKGKTSRVRLMDGDPGASHPQIRQHQGVLYFAWKRFDGRTMKILLAQSNDAGKSWSEPLTLAQTRGASDHPALVRLDEALFLAWHTQQEGYRLIPVSKSPIEEKSL